MKQARLKSGSARQCSGGGLHRWLGGWGAVLLVVLLSAGCVGIPSGVEPVSGFDVERYLGRWYEVARLDNRFERGLSDVTADYSQRADGAIAVVNRGYNVEDGAWEQAEGTAKPVGAADVGRLKVSFFGPFYAGYNVIVLDADYRYAMVAGNDRDYLWILARSPVLDAAIVDRLVARARSLGFAVDELVFVEHSRH